MLPRGGGDTGDAGSGDGGRFGTAGRASLLGFARRGFAAPDFGGAAVGGRSVRGVRGMRPSCPASDFGPRFDALVSSFLGLRIYHQPRSFHHASPIVL